MNMQRRDLKNLVLARSISASVYGVSQYMAGKITRSPNGNWLLKAEDSRMRTVKIGDMQICRPGWSISVVGCANHTLPEFIASCEDGLQGCFPNCKIYAYVLASSGDYCVTREPWRGVEFDILPEEESQWTVSWSKE